jgi:twinkle protein
MNEFEFTSKYLGSFKTKGKEIIAEYCPFCSGGKHRDKHTFYLNPENHVYCCHRGSCNARGTFAELAKEFSERADYYMEYKKRSFEMNFEKKEYEKPKMKLNQLSKQAEKYIYERKISLTTATHFNVNCDNKGNIVFSYYDENGEHCLNKIRIPRKFVKGKDTTKIWQEGAGKPILMGMDKADINTPIVITEGEWDCLSVYEAGYKNVVSIPFGTNNMDWVAECWEWLESCKEFIIWFDSDNAGKKAANEVMRKLGVYKCRVVKSKDKDANVTLFKNGSKTVTDLIKNAQYVPIEHLQRLADVQKKETERILFGNNFLDYNLGGCRMGELTIWTGKRGSGKSTVLSQTLIDTVEQKYKCFMYSGEMNNSKVKEWLERQMAGEKYIVTFKDQLTGREEYGVHPQISPILGEWYKDYVYCYGDDGSDDLEDLMEIMEYAYKRHNIKRFVLDNLKTIKAKDNKDFYKAQGELINRLRKFAITYETHIDLVAHPRKTSKEELSDEDVGGSSDIIDLAHNIIEVQKIDHDKLSDDADPKLLDNNTILRVKKNREYGDVDKAAYYKFNPKSKRIYGTSGTKKYSWETEEVRKRFNNSNPINEFIEIEEEQCPF